MVDGEEPYIAEQVLDSQLMRGQLQFLVKWEGYGYEENSWVPESDIAALDKIREFCCDKTDMNNFFLIKNINKEN